ncbi:MULTISPECIES: peptide chain release factor N(5)-glutamine methyltransferase [Variovorax]|jgi:release factor glutamine methyltransferase|uniref:peptide chain release factor N(5)-glutamine methyltransferase n=1 Tax=Variovorax TaxID=34072 RepID=UPI00086CE350|nr:MULTISPECIES: peptide chain release factor N(5)-glutamine methyltransferase [Variovorax]MBN8756509.1 peptide chain release factor N(5)-glutamine methyltransferase [Variovorax sp.]ODU13492.1 MAG: protein-(glutamine-N5) methyltransferase, release factor-specific [Variovorax sp. SCN 67-85]ODV24964.1 MAG: protein-(glutamine-N5) methyltransferase, release factor-specific [Variovorax sp. SCN 67-20]OJZ11100.1 MAG: protein-(glutamine-N5) methyltransferase, release factor-specific [Variovorax sp. 67-
MTVDNPKPSTVAQALAAAIALGIDRLDAQLLLLHALGRAPHDRAWLLAHDTDALRDEAWSALSTQLSRRLAGEPVAYLLGEKEFHGLDLRVDARVLVPRPDTETLVEWALECLEGHAAPRVLDLGTGSGAIALALQHARADAQVDAVDTSADALAVAQANAQRLGLPVRFALANWLDGAETGYAVIASNPPYIAANDPHLPALRHEPVSALVAGTDGLDDIRQIVRHAPAHLAEGGWLLLEHGHDQAAAVRQLLAERGFAEVQSREDLAGIQRCSGGIWRTVK